MSIRTPFNPLGTLGGAEPLPPGYTRVKCLVSNGHQCIDTGHSPTFKTRWEVDYSYIGRVTNSSRMGCSYDSTSIGVARFCLTPQGYDEEVFGAANTPTVVASPVSSHNRAVSVLDNVTGTFSVAGYEFVTPVAEVLPAHTMALFARHSRYGNNFDYDCPIIGKVYRSRIFEDGQLVQDFVPCLDQNGVAVMYDLVEGATYRAVKLRDYDLQPFGYEL